MSTKPKRVYTVYRRCHNWEAGDVLFEGEPLVWFDSLAAARAVYNESRNQAQDCLVKECEIIRRNEFPEFASGDTWAATLLGFPRERGEALPTARERIEHKLRDEENGDINERRRAAVIAADGGRMDLCKERAPRRMLSPPISTMSLSS